jgi:hypothetical protein
MLGLQETPGVLTTIHPTVALPTDVSDFWGFARKFGEAIKVSRTIEAARAGAVAVAHAMAAERDAATMRQ